MIKENKYNKLMEEDCLEVVIHKYVLNKIRKWAIRKIITNDHCEFLIDYEKENFVKRFE